MLCTFERKILRIIYGPMQGKGRWHPRRKIEIDNLLKDLNIVGDIEIERLGCLGHFIRMDNGRIPKEKVLNGKFDNARPVGKPRTRWEDVTRNARMEETSRRQRKMETSSEGGQGPERAVAPWMEWSGILKPCFRGKLFGGVSGTYCTGIHRGKWKLSL